jgi:serine O-acetyltransferase
MNKLINEIISDFKCHGGTSLKKIIQIYFFDPSFNLLLNYRLGSYFRGKKSTLYIFISNYLRYKQITKRNCDISFNSIIGSRIKFIHPIGIIIGDKTIIGDDVRIYHQVTLGSHGRAHGKFEYPIVGNSVTIFPGAKLIGGILIGDRAVVATNAVVKINIPADHIAAGVPAKIMRKNE